MSMVPQRVYQLALGHPGAPLDPDLASTIQKFILGPLVVILVASAPPTDARPPFVRRLVRDPRGLFLAHPFLAQRLVLFGILDRCTMVVARHQNLLMSRSSVHVKRGGSRGQTRPKQPLGLFRTLLALVLRSAEKLHQFRVARPLGVLAVDLKPQGVTQARLGEPDEVVILICGTSDTSSLLSCHHYLTPTLLAGRFGLTAHRIY